MQAPTPSTDPVLPARRRSGRLVLGVVIALSTVLAFALVLLTQDNSLGQRQRRARADVRRLEGLLGSYLRVMGRYPVDDAEFKRTIRMETMKDFPADPWGRPYQYALRGGMGYVYTLGADGKPGGAGEDADVTAGGVESVDPQAPAAGGGTP